MSFSESESKQIDEEAYLVGTYAELGEVERATLVHVARRLKMGQDQYGEFRRDDPRNFTVEARDESLDQTVYLTRDLVGKAMGPKVKRKRAKK